MVTQCNKCAAKHLLSAEVSLLEAAATGRTPPGAGELRPIVRDLLNAPLEVHIHNHREDFQTHER